MRAVYGQIYEDLLAQIEGGEYPYQGFIPSEAELCERYKCSHNTARRAVRLLAQEGYVQPINGKGVRVIYLPADREDFSIGGIETFKEAARRNDFEVVTKVIGLEQEVVTPTFARESGFPEGSTVTHVDRVRMIDGRAQILDRNWYLTELVPDITPKIAADSIYAYIEGTLGMRVTCGRGGEPHVQRRRHHVRVHVLAAPPKAVLVHDRGAARPALGAGRLSGPRGDLAVRTWLRGGVANPPAPLGRMP